MNGPQILEIHRPVPYVVSNYYTSSQPTRMQEHAIAAKFKREKIKDEIVAKQIQSGILGKLKKKERRKKKK